ncbi:helix-turn-helix transcriptional regulator [Clostridium tyrobutyricum]|uniref:helix-turn-helix transcriptional regulator n=1 Tax=Clostridium tyrobutyricum TaxID=1519 RepID=UPI001C38EA61|nr:helix-turn-helix transcriptional regulator [Clostridium tyrobutyricum]MBV4429474.1 helix-turn-helix transcriptional regulator [Clostridium tyrobutyricum]MBV4440239.1 helix-turn-helix transcriptional regulator [Clostridium tyrobutyricum]MBV4444695.1 helix-turn-helix transcriptional regulator [Clostridium tyrobutyricum]
MRKNLRKCRLNKKLSVEDISKVLNISKSYYYKIESGLRNPTMVLAKQIANLLEEDIESLFFNNNLDKMSNKNSYISL